MYTVIYIRQQKVIWKVRKENCKTYNKLAKEKRVNKTNNRILDKLPYVAYKKQRKKRSIKWKKEKQNRYEKVER